jgi:hypothetical protein
MPPISPTSDADRAGALALYDTYQLFLADTAQVELLGGTEVVSRLRALDSMLYMMVNEQIYPVCGDFGESEPPNSDPPCDGSWSRPADESTYYSYDLVENLRRSMRQELVN